MWPMGLLFLKTSPVKQDSYENDFSGVFDALHQSFLVCFCNSALCFPVLFAVVDTWNVFASLLST